MSMATAAAGSRHLRSGEATPSKLGPDPIAASGPVPRHRSAESMGVGAQLWPRELAGCAGLLAGHLVDRRAQPPSRRSKFHSCSIETWNNHGICTDPWHSCWGGSIGGRCARGVIAAGAWGWSSCWGGSIGGRSARGVIAAGGVVGGVGVEIPHPLTPQLHPQLLEQLVVVVGRRRRSRCTWRSCTCASRAPGRLPQPPGSPPSSPTTPTSVAPSLGAAPHWPP